jgi:signal transduction histidine kinase/DNA-binding LacI/PurR family transcriptional regulator
MEDSGKRLTIGYFNQVLVDDWAYFPWLGIVSAARKRDINLVSFHGNSILETAGFDEQANILYDLARGGRLDGLVTWKGHISKNLSDAEFETFCKRYEVPFVTIEDFLPGYPSVTYANYEGMRLIVEHLIGTHGYTKIGFAGYVKAEIHIGFQERYRAFSDTMKKHSLAIDPSWVTPLRVWAPPESGRSADDEIDDWLKAMVSRGIDAIIGICDPIALWVMERLVKLGTSVPGDVAVAGYDSFNHSRVSNPPLTTVDPSWEELGSLALETVMELINGGDRVEQKRVVPAKLVVARSCGCVEDNVKRAAGLPSSDIQSGADIDRLVSEMIRVMPVTEKERIRGVCENIAASFSDCIPANDGDLFLASLEKALTLSIDAGTDVLCWQNVISVMQGYAAGRTLDENRISNLNILCQQARVLIGNTASRLQEHKRLVTEASIDRERTLGLSLITTFNLVQLLELLDRGLPGLGIPSFYMSIYEEPKTYSYPGVAPEWARLVLAHDKDGRKLLDPEGIRYRSHELVPDAFWPKGQALNLSVNALYFRDTQIGFIIFDAIPRDQRVFEIFRVQLSSALKGVLLVKKVEQQMNDLTVSNAELERSYAELKKNQQTLLATEKMASLGRLSAGIAHEMNTPLAAVRATLRELGLLAEEYRKSAGNPNVTDEDHRAIASDMLKNINIATLSAEKSVGFIRGIKSQTQSQLSDTNQSFNACDIAADTLIVLEHLFKHNRCALVRDICDGIIISGNPRSFGQILTNILVNAIDACKPEGRSVFISLASDGNCTILTVRDTGAGISKENVTKIFEPFFTTKPFGEGTGLGLSIVYDLVNEFGGTIDVESVPGNTVFRIVFPHRKES